MSAEFKTKGKILVVRGGALGDFILTLPVLEALRNRFPETHLEILGYNSVTELALGSGLVDGVKHIESRGLASFFARQGQLDSDFVDYFEQFDMVISFLYDPDNYFKNNVIRCTSGQFIQGIHKAQDNGELHASSAYLKVLEKLAIFESDPVPHLKLPDKPGPLPAGKWVALHPGSGSPKKNWEPEFWLALVDALLVDPENRILLVAGEADAELASALGAIIDKSQRGMVLFNRPLAEVARHLAAAESYIGHDSGITHLAGALGLKGAVLWRDSKKEIWRPLNPNFIHLDQSFAPRAVDLIVREIV